MSEFSLVHRATIVNISFEYGATMDFFSMDHVTLQYLKIFDKFSTPMSCIIF